MKCYEQNAENASSPSIAFLLRLDAALKRLVLSVPRIKKNVLNACAETVAADGLPQGAEAELLRAIADSLDCPIPPFLPTAFA